MNGLLKLLKWFDNKNFISVRAGVLYVTVWMTWLAFDWAGTFATTTAKDGAEVALIIAAVTAPISALQMFIFKVYSESRSA